MDSYRLKSGWIILLNFISTFCYIRWDASDPGECNQSGSVVVI